MRTRCVGGLPAVREPGREALGRGSAVNAFLN